MDDELYEYQNYFHVDDFINAIFGEVFWHGKIISANRLIDVDY